MAWRSQREGERGGSPEATAIALLSWDMEVEEGMREGEEERGGSPEAAAAALSLVAWGRGGEGERGSSPEAAAVALLSGGMGVAEGGRGDGWGTHGSGGAAPRAAREGAAASVSVWSGLSDVRQVDEDKTRGASGGARATSGGKEARQTPDI